MKDPIVEEVRKIRRKIEADCKRRGISLYEYYLQEQEKYPGRLVNRGPHRLYRDVSEETTRKVAEPAAAWKTKKRAMIRKRKSKPP
jgi:hypothetical protein